MSHAQVETQNHQSENHSRPQQPIWAVPVVLAILMVSGGAFFVLVALGISIFSSIDY